MNEMEEFERLKKQMLEDNKAYIEAVGKASCEDWNELDVRVELVDLYANFIRSHLAYRNFITEYKRSKKAAIAA